MFRDMLNEIVTLVKKDGTVANEKIKALVQSNKIFMDDPKLPIEPGDSLLRLLPSGLVEEYIVVDPGFYAGMGGIVPHFQTVVRRSGASPAQAHTIINHIQGQNARINIGSVDHSKNVAIENETPEIFQSLREILSKSNIQDGERDALSTAIEKMERSYPGGTFKDSYVNFMSLAANHVAVFGPLLGGLASLLR
ncbi:MAG: hypothetical protein NXI18_13185 [Alphaproteobacteria bacterium]|nr:hypothetical protein [Alphaproteobacteria bacterium]